MRLSTLGEPPAYPFRITDPFQLPVEFAQLRAEEPVCKVWLATGDEVWLVTRYDDVRAVLGDQRFSRDIFRPDAARLTADVPTRQVGSPFLDPPVHTRWRKLVIRAFTPEYVEGLRGQVQAIVDKLLDEVQAAPRPADLVSMFAYPLSISTLFELLGIPNAQHWPWRALADTALTINDVSPQEKADAFVQINAFSAELIATKRSYPAEDFLSRLVTIDSADGWLSEQELVATVLAMLVGGYESAANQIGRTLLALFRYPDQLATLRAHPSLTGSAIEEGLRFAALEGGLGSPRYALEDVQLGDVTIPKGSTVLVIRQSADRDEMRYPEPERFDITRDARQHHAFGHGPHRCPGAALARLELEVGIGTLLRRFPRLALAVPPKRIKWDYRITAAGPVTLPVTW
jgi:cytochrome P450